VTVRLFGVTSKPTEARREIIASIVIEAGEGDERDPTRLCEETSKKSDVGTSASGTPTTLFPPTPLYRVYRAHSSPHKGFSSRNYLTSMTSFIARGGQLRVVPKSPAPSAPGFSAVQGIRNERGILPASGCAGGIG
jgi:hypothetical protein